jgi:glycosyltransferase involved in cell wall biosynthesis
MRRIGIPAHGFMDWGGGVDFLRLISDSLRQARPDIELHAFVPGQGPLSSLRSLRDSARALAGRQAPSSQRPALEHIERVFAEADAAVHRIDIGMRALARACERQGIDALVPAMTPLPPGLPPWVGYVPDFQHRHLPQFFAEDERARRDAYFARMLDSACAVIVNARAVVKDIEHYHPGHRARVYALPFSPAPGRDAFSVDIDEARRRHGVTGPYFIICNQFWRHKDHGTAFRAFATIARRHPEMSLVCTGATDDFRFPGFFEDLMRQAARDGVAGRIRVLGLIPKPDQLALLRGAMALIQPTLFEGGPGGGAVYDAVAVGQRAIVSDIPVNKEISESTVSFFSAADADGLVARMDRLLDGTTGWPSQPSARELQRHGIERRVACGHVLFNALIFAKSERSFS